MKKKTILLTGSGGFVGGSLSKYLGDKFNLISPSKKLLLSIISNNNNNNKNNSCYNDINKVKIDFVIHLAGKIRGSKKSLQKSNILLTKHVVNFCKQEKVPLIFLSTILVSRDTFYGQSKLYAENIIQNGEINFSIIRSSVIYGGGDNKNIASLQKIIQKSRFIPVISNGKFKIQPVHVCDLCELINKILFNNSFNNKIYNIAGPNILSYKQIIDMISKNNGRKIIKINIPTILIKVIYNILKPFNDFISIDILDTISSDTIVNIDDTIKEFSLHLRNFENEIKYI